MIKHLSTLAAALALATSANASLLSEYDGSDGNLIGATLTITGNAHYFGSLNKTSTDNGSVIASADVKVDFDFFSDKASVLSLLSTLSDTQGSGNFVLTPNAPNSFFDIFFEIPLTDIDLASILGDLTGFDTFNVDCSAILVADETYTGQPGGAVGQGSIDGSGCSASIKYVGDDVVVDLPEPGTMALFGLALAGMGLIARRRKSA